MSKDNTVTTNKWYWAQINLCRVIAEQSVRYGKKAEARKDLKLFFDHFWIDCDDTKAIMRKREKVMKTLAKKYHEDYPK